MELESPVIVSIVIAIIMGLWAIASTGFILVQRRQDDKDEVQDRTVREMKEEIDKREVETKKAFKETKEQIKDNQKGIETHLEAITKMLIELKVQMGETYQKHIRIEQAAGKNEANIKELDKKYQELGKDIVSMEGELKSLKEEFHNSRKAS